MTKDKSIFIKNIYYMLTYAFQVLKQSNFEEVASEEFTEIHDLFAAILDKGISQQIKQGLFREYVSQHESLPVMRGKLDISGTIQNKIQRRQCLSCDYDELSVNNIYNQILKTTIHYLIKVDNVKKEIKASLRRLLMFFDDVKLLLPSEIQWNRVYFQRSNQNYEMLLNICYFVLEGMLQTSEDGHYKMEAFSDERMAALYEKFILEYYKQHHKYLSDVRSAQITWNLQGENELSSIRFLPAMQSDVYLRLDDRILIIDAKYYGKTLQKQYDKYALHSGNIYQIFTYVKNQDKNNTGKVAGLLLYAKTDEPVTPDCEFNIGGNQICAKTLDLNADFKNIALQLDAIAFDYFQPTTVQLLERTML